MEKYMLETLKEADKAFKKGETPIGAIVVCDDKIVARAHNLKESKNNPFAHAEIIAIKKACKKIGDWRLNDCLLFVNLEPCIMCMGLIAETRIKKVYCSTRNNKYKHSLDVIVANSKIDIEYGIFEEKSKKILKDFFEIQRKK